MRKVISVNEGWKFYKGASDLQVILNVREAVAAALGTNQNAVKVYLKKV